jgi:hypothetical protein
MRLFCAVVAAISLTVALVRSPFGPDPASVRLVCAALVLAVIGSWPAPVNWSITVTPWLARLALVLLVVWQLTYLFLLPPSIYLRLDVFEVFFSQGAERAQAYARETLPEARPLWLYVYAVCLIGAVAISYVWPWFHRGRFALILVLFAVLGAWVIKSSSQPAIDVWHLQQGACAYLLEGKNPYAQRYPNPYDNADFFGPGMLEDNQIVSVPYPPLSLLMALPGYVIGHDVRWSMLAAMLLAGALFVMAGRRLGLPPGHPAELAALAFLAQPRSLLVLEQSWTEPFVILSLAFAFWAMAAHKERLVALGLAATICAKQYGLLVLPPAWGARCGWRTLVQAVLGAALFTLPWVLWDPRAFWTGIVTFHTSSPFRVDSLSVSALIARETGWQPPATLGFAAAALTALLVVWRQQATLASAVLGTAAVFLAFFAFGKAGHVNYYWLTAGLLDFAVLAAIAEIAVAKEVAKTEPIAEHEALPAPEEPSTEHS